MQIGGKKKKAIFHTCLHELRKYKAGELLQDYLKIQRTKIFQILDIHRITKDLYKERIDEILSLINKTFYENCIIPE